MSLVLRSDSRLRELWTGWEQGGKGRTEMGGCNSPAAVGSRVRSSSRAEACAFSNQNEANVPEGDEPGGERVVWRHKPTKSGGSQRLPSLSHEQYSGDEEFHHWGAIAFYKKCELLCRNKIRTRPEEILGGSWEVITYERSWDRVKQSRWGIGTGSHWNCFQDLWNLNRLGTPILGCIKKE